MLTATGLNRAKELSELEMTEAEGIFALVQQRTVETAAEYETAVGWLQDLKAKQKELETDRKEIVDPLTKAKKLVDALFERPLAKLKAAENVLKAALLNYQHRATQREQAALNAAVLASNAGDRQGAVALIAQASAQQTSVSGISTRQIPDFRMLDASLLPREYLMADETAIRKAVKAANGQIEIPGVEVFFKASMTVRAS